MQVHVRLTETKSTVVYSMKNKYCAYGLQLEIVMDRLLNPLMPNTFSCF
jgi:hypothetical protein